MMNRVTRLGEFSPIGRLFTLSSFLFYKNIAICMNVCINFDKNGLGYILVDFLLQR
jgi:hypothetical protein